LRERVTLGNFQVKHLVVTNIYEWFVFDAEIFDRLFYRDNDLVKQFKGFEEKQFSSNKTDVFYKEIAKPAIAQVIDKLEFTHFDLRDLENLDLIDLYKIFSPEHLLKIRSANDSNSLNKPFYNELLHIIGLTEIKDKGKKLIGRRAEGDRHDGSLIENAIHELDSSDKISQLEKPEEFGETHEERLFNVALRLSITWINRVLFLKLLEAQLLKYHDNDQDFAFLNLTKIKSYSDLNRLFFSVLAREQGDRIASVKETFANVPYLNSSLFELTDIEQKTISISNLASENLPIFVATVLIDGNERKRSGELNALEYLFEFLHAYKFSKDEFEDTQEDSEKLINASVLGLIFEKINGYRDGSFYTPSFITMYMCRETIRRAVVQKFNEVKSWSCENIQDLCDDLGSYIKERDRVVRRNEANGIVNSLKICDPAVGSGHFLVSALNEMIAIKQYLGILQDRNGESLSKYEIEVVNDKLKVTLDGKLFAYNPKNKESQRVQEALFHEKQTIIEGCLFGVDINPNSVTICRLRLWIELLKNAYYRWDSPQASIGIDPPQPPLKRGENKVNSLPPFTRGGRGDLETLPNIDINIKCGNSLISRFGLDVDVKQVLQKQKFSIEQYRDAVQTYRSAESKAQKREMEELIAKIKKSFKITLQGIDPKKTKVRRLEGEIENLQDQKWIIEPTKEERKVQERKIAKLNIEIAKLNIEIEDIESGKIYKNTLEWRFEFPEVLNDDGDFVGFDVVIGNPPYVPSKNLDEKEKGFYYEHYKTTEYQINTFGIFTELSIQILKSKGLLGLIIPNYWLTTKYDKKLRRFLFEENQTRNIVNVYSIFESAVVETLLLFSKKEPNNDEIHICSIDRNISTINQRLEAVMLSDWSYDEKITLSDLDEELTLSFDNKIKINAESLMGFLFDLKFGAKLYEVGKGNPPQTKNDGKNKIYEGESKIDDSYIKLLRARDVQRYSLKTDNYYVKYGENLAAPRSISIFEGERILVQRIFSKERLDATYTDETIICNTDVITLKPKNSTVNVKFYLAIICSKLCASVLKSQNVNLDRNAFPKINTETLSTFPVPKYKHEYINITLMVDEILTAKKGNRHADTNELERAIDNLVYKLYQLTYDEVKIIDPEFELTEQEYTAIKTG
jgi:tRNA1(Val) A37 N6-methylase TrmN6